MPIPNAPVLGLPEGTSVAVEQSVMALVAFASILQVFLWGLMTFEVRDWVMERRPEFKTDACYYPMVWIGSFLVGIFAIPLAIYWLYDRCCMSDTTTCCGRARHGTRAAVARDLEAGVRRDQPQQQEAMELPSYNEAVRQGINPA
ncbi:hypothetical protein QBC44DRAFT_77047 [Cladorrhinum sp. PSN332]|nr:hypothetical protein QBC44DRAFT_77047 [Cladorrhinum sp. PSN332]